MNILLCFFVHLFLALSTPHFSGVESKTSSNRIHNERNVTFIDLNEKDSDDLIHHWTQQAISGVMAAIANKKLKFLTENQKIILENCSKNAKSLENHAKCILPALDLAENGKVVPHDSRKNPAEKIKKLMPNIFRIGNLDGLAKDSSMPNQEKIKRGKTWQIGSFFVDENARKKRSTDFQPKTQNSFQVLPSQKSMTPIGMFAKYFLAGILKEKSKTIKEKIPWQISVHKAKMAGIKRKKMKDLQKRKELMDPVENMVLNLLENQQFGTNNDDGSFDANQLEKLLEEKRNDKQPIRRILNVLRDGIKLGFMAAGQNVTNFDRKTMKIVSPKFLSVFPEETDKDSTVDVLSPSLFALHSGGNGMEKKLSLPSLFQGFTKADQQEWLDLIFEAAGVEDAIKNAEKVLADEEFQVKRKKRYMEKMVDENGQPLYLTSEKASEVLGPVQERRNKLFEELEKSYTIQQKQEAEQVGFAVMNRQQIQAVYGNGSIHADSKLLERFLNLDEQEIHEQILRDIRALANGRSRRQKRDIVLSPITFSNVLFAPQVASQPIVLSPIIFTNVIGSYAILGPVILSPWLFLPLILSPRVLSPTILSPLGFVPLILTPLVLHPVILCPGIFNPLVLSPAVLSPLILSPQVFTPMILSPLVLTPFILTPTVGSPLILSPYVLTPVIYSPLALFALVLSPHALSPLIASKVFLAEIVLSPGVLS